MKKLLLIPLTLSLLNFGLFSQNQNNALDFRNNNYVNINNIAPDVANLNSFTIEFWIRFDAQETPVYSAFYGANVSNYKNKIVIRLSGPVDGVQSKAVVLLQSATKEYLIGGHTIGDNRCHHIAFTYDNKSCTLYVDGILDATANHDIEFQSSDVHSLGQEYDNSPMGPSDFYNGEMDEFRIWNYAKTQTEIQDGNNHELTGNEPGLLVYFDFNQGIANGNNTSITSLENKASSHNGTLVNFDLNNSTSNFIKEACPIATLGIDNNETLNHIEIGPNPTDGLININNPNNLSAINIKNTLGQIVLQPKPSNVINIGDLPRACYFMQVIDNKGNSKTIKIIKQ